MPAVCPTCGGWTATARGCSQCGDGDAVRTTPTFVVTGASGSGKSTVVEYLHTRLPNCVVVDTDVFLDLAEHGYEVLWDSLSRLALAVSAGGRSAVLCGTLLPENFEATPSRELLGPVTYLNLDVADDVRAGRLRARPAWRDSSDPEFIERHLAFAEHLRRRGDMTSLDTTVLSAEDVGDAVAAWVEAVLTND